MSMSMEVGADVAEAALAPLKSLVDSDTLVYLVSILADYPPSFFTPDSVKDVIEPFIDGCDTNLICSTIASSISADHVAFARPSPPPSSLPTPAPAQPLQPPPQWGKSDVGESVDALYKKKEKKKKGKQVLVEEQPIQANHDEDVLDAASWDEHRIREGWEEVEGGGIVTTERSRFRIDRVGDAKDINIPGITITYGGRDLLNLATLKLRFGARYGMIGRNGVGKSTLMKAISLGKIARFPPHLTTLYVDQEATGSDSSAFETVMEADRRGSALKKEEARLLGQTEYQERLAELYAEMDRLELHAAPRRAQAALDQMGFTPKQMEMPVKALSGGWRMRVALASVLFVQPDICMLDEPTNHLDLSGVVWLEHFLTSLTCTVLVVSHDRDFLDAVTTDTIHFTKSALSYYPGNYSAFKQIKTDNELKQLREYERQNAQEEHIKSTIQTAMSGPRHPSVSSMIASRKKKLDRIGEEKTAAGHKKKVLSLQSKHGHLVWDGFRQRTQAPVVEPPVKFAFGAAPTLGDDASVIQFRDVAFSFEGAAKPLFNSVRLNVMSGSRIALLGDNGSGKTTLLQLLEGTLAPQSGAVWRHPNSSLAVFRQHHIDSLDHSLSAVEMLISLNHGMKDEEARKHLGGFLLSGEVVLRPISTLSGGQKSCLSLALLMVKPPHTLVLDEPTNHLDLFAVEGLTSGLSEYAGTVIVVSHDRHLIRSVASEFYVIEKRSLKQLDGMDGFEQYLKSKGRGVLPA